jgi:hypothetical protein
VTEQAGAEPRAEVYARAPLGAVAIEVYFNPLLDALERLGRFQREHAREFVHMILPDELDTPTLRRRRAATLIHASGDRAIAVGRDVVAAVTYVYHEGFAGFLAWSLPVLRNALATIDPSRIERVRYVYENEIHLPEIDGNVELERTFKLSLPRGEGASSSVRHLHMGWTRTWPAGAVDVRLDCCHESMDPGALDLSIAAVCDGPFATAELEGRIREAHRMARLTFEGTITDGYRDQLRKQSDA